METTTQKPSAQRGPQALVGSGRLVQPSFEIVEVGDGIHHGVRDGVTLYRIWPTPMSRKRYAASFFGGRNVLASFL